MKLSNLAENRLVVERPESPFTTSLTHQDEVQASVRKSGDEWLLNVVLSNFIPEVMARYTDFATVQKAVEDLGVLGISVRGTRTPEWEAEVESMETKSQVKRARREGDDSDPIFDRQQ